MYNQATGEQQHNTIDYLHFDHSSIVDICQDIGREVRAQVWRITNSHLINSDDTSVLRQIIRARRIHEFLKTISRNQRNCKAVRFAIVEYMESLASWAKGALLSELANERRYSKLGLTGLDLAYMLQAEETGCQSGVYRDSDDSVVVWHTEEDNSKPGERFDKLRIISYPFKNGGEGGKVYTFLYPDLLPGPAFSWREKDYIQFVDSLYTMMPTSSEAIPANIATWVTFRLAREVEPEQIITELGPFLDGYAMFFITSSGSAVTAKRIEFAGKDHLTTLLGSVRHSSINQVNIFSPEASYLKAKYEPPITKRPMFEKRLYRIHSHLQKASTINDPIQGIWEMLCSTEGGDYAFNNNSVKAHLLARMSSTGLDIWVGAGAAKPPTRANHFSFRQSQ